MGFFSDFLTWLKGRNLCPSLMNDKQELEKLGEYEEENGGIGTYLHRVVIEWMYEEEQTGKEVTAVYLLTSTKKEEIFTNSGVGQGITDRLENQGFVYSSGVVYDRETADSFQLASINSKTTSTPDLEIISGITYEIADGGVPADPAKMLETGMLYTYRETIKPV